MQTLVKNLSKRTVLGALIALSLAACTQTNPAPIRDVSERGKPVYKEPARVVTQDDSNYTPPPASIETQKAPQSNTPVRAPSTVTQSTVAQSANNAAQAPTMSYQRDYNEIPKGGYRGNTYTVQRGDTLFYIAWITGNDFRELAQRNNVSAPYGLSVGQTLDVSGGLPSSTAIAQNNQQPQKVEPVVPAKPPAKPIFKPKPTQTVNNTVNVQKPSKPTSTGSTQTLITETVTTTKPHVVTAPKEPVVSAVPEVVTTPPPQTQQVATSNVGNISWQWPVRGSIIAPFSSSPTGNKGIDISGSQGQEIQAAAAGSVVYAGNALPGYGNLIIIKHNDDYLTAYAHNDKILVQEQQSVRAGQRIATMGKTGTSSTRLHFEIRYKAKSVDPMGYLPR